MIYRLAILTAFLIACSEQNADTGDAGARTPALPGPPAATTASSCETTEFDGSGIGALRIGASVAGVKAACRVVRDTTVIGAEAMPARMLWVEMRGDTVAAEIVDEKVWRIAIKSPAFHTDDSLRVGTLVERLLRLEGARGMMGEGALYVTANAHCGVSFRLSQNKPYDPTGNWRGSALARLPRSTHVTEVLIFGCTQRSKSRPS